MSDVYLSDVCICVCVCLIPDVRMTDEMPPSPPPSSCPGNLLMDVATYLLSRSI